MRSPRPLSASIWSRSVAGPPRARGVRRRGRRRAMRRPGRRGWIRSCRTPARDPVAARHGAVPMYAGPRERGPPALTCEDGLETRQCRRDRAEEMHMDAAFTVPEPRNEPVRTYAPNSTERASLQRRLGELAGDQLDLPLTVDGRQRMAGGDAIDVVQPHKHRHVLGVTHNSTNEDAAAAVAAAKKAAPMWRALPYEERAAIFLRAADLLAGPWRDTLNGATMLGQSKTVIQAEIDSACELIDFLRFNVHFGHKMLGEQPNSSAGVWNRFDHRPLEGFVVAITPFNFSAIAGNLPSTPALMGVPVVWKPSVTQQF